MSSKKKSKAAGSKKSKEQAPFKPSPPKPKARSEGKLSILDAAARVLKENSGQPMNCAQMIEKMLAAKYWQTKGKTPAATLSSALLREITTKGKESRFRKVERGQFALA